MVYLDYAATSPLLPEAIEAMREAEQKFFANASALHTPGHLSMNKIDDARELLAQLINAEPDEIIFTSGASAIASTSALSELAKGKTLDEAVKITAKDIDDYLGNLPKHKFHCSVLGHQALADAVKNYRAQNKTKNN